MIVNMERTQYRSTEELRKARVIIEEALARLQEGDLMVPIYQKHLFQLNLEIKEREDNYETS